jgi:hypothetical protein
MDRRTSLVLAVVLLALLLYVVVIQRPAEEASTAATATAVSVSPTRPATTGSLWPDLTAEQIMGIRVVDQAGSRSVAFSRTDAQAEWNLTEPDAQPADKTLADGAATSASLLTYSNVITTAADLSVFGVLSPTYSIEIKLADGSLKKAVVGDKTITGDSYYVLRDGETMVLVISQSALQQLTRLLDAPPYPPTATPAFALPTPDVTGTPTPTTTP